MKEFPSFLYSYSMDTKSKGIFIVYTKTDTIFKLVKVDAHSGQFQLVKGNPNSWLRGRVMHWYLAQLTIHPEYFNHFINTEELTKAETWNSIINFYTRQDYLSCLRKNNSNIR